MIIAAHQTMMGPQEAPLPYDAEVEYLESNGSQWVDTGIAPANPGNNSYHAVVSWSEVSTRKIMGRQGSFYFGVVNGYFQAGQGGTTNTRIAISANTFHDITTTMNSTTVGAAATQSCVVDGRTASATVFYNNDPSASATIWVFCANNATSLRGGSRVSLFQITIGGVLVRDYIPVRVGSGSSSVGYLFDRVSGELFGNAGTGAFTIGPDKT